MSNAVLKSAGLDSPFLREVTAGLRRRPKSISPKWFYDQRGSELFEQITRQPEYYPTRTEIELLASITDQLRMALDDRRALIEYGSGSSRKTRLLLRALPQLDLYLPMDVSAEYLRGAADGVDKQFPGLQVRPIIGDFNAPIRIPAEAQALAKLGFFPGSTIGNLEPAKAGEFLRLRRAELGEGGKLLIGVDLRKPVDVLLAAYDDAAGVTAEFNRNLLERINCELGADFDPQRFEHQARWDDDHGRIEMHLVSQGAQSVSVAGQKYHFADGESIHSENSHKYRVGEFKVLARASGWEVDQLWTDSQQWFGVFLLS